MKSMSLVRIDTVEPHGHTVERTNLTGEQKHKIEIKDIKDVKTHNCTL